MRTGRRFYIWPEYGWVLIRWALQHTRYVEACVVGLFQERDLHLQDLGNVFINSLNVVQNLCSPPPLFSRARLLQERDLHL